MNSPYEFHEPVIHPIDDEDIPTNLALMPKIFRLENIEQEIIDKNRIQVRALLFHEKAAMNVTWTTNHFDLRLKVDCLVSPRWVHATRCEKGAIKISRLVLIEKPEPWENLFHTVPYKWVKKREVIQQAAQLIDTLPRAYRLLFNAVFWDGQRFQRFCTVPCSVSGNPADDNGNIRHAVEVAHMMQQFCLDHPQVNESLAILAGLFHDAGKAEEFYLSSQGEWIISDRGKLLEHKVTAIEWLAEAKAKCNLLIPPEHYMALLHCLTCTASEGLGIRNPNMLEAELLAFMDKLSATEELMQRSATGKNRWGIYHTQLNECAYQLNSLSVHSLRSSYTEVNSVIFNVIRHSRTDKSIQIMEN